MKVSFVLVHQQHVFILHRVEKQHVIVVIHQVYFKMQRQ